jgi:glutamate racemase
MPVQSDTDHSEQPIGVFDSGIGGLTVVREIHRLLPHESTIYFGDTARVPYGPKSEGIVRRFALQNARFLTELGVKAIVIACNTASSVALQTLQDRFPLPVIGVIEPGVKAAVHATKSGNIGVIGTVGTIESEAYHRAIRRSKGRLRVFGQACPLFVPLAEEGWLTKESTYLIAKEYLTPLLRHHIDTLILGCTHYPLLKPAISKVLGQEITLIDSAEQTATELRSLLMERNMVSKQKSRPQQRYYVSDVPRRFREVAQRFLGKNIGPVHQIDIETFEPQ